MCNSFVYVLYVGGKKKKKKAKGRGHLRSLRFGIRHCDLEEACLSIVDNILNSRDCSRDLDLFAGVYQPQNKMVLYDSVMPVEVELDGQKWSRVNQSHREREPGRRICVFYV